MPHCLCDKEEFLSHKKTMCRFFSLVTLELGELIQKLKT